MPTAAHALTTGRAGALAPTFVTRIKPRTVMVYARDLAPMGVRRFGGTYRMYLAQALRMAWAEMRRRRVDLLAMERRVLACVESIRADGRARRDRLAAINALPYVARPVDPARLQLGSWAPAAAAVPAVQAA